MNTATTSKPLAATLADFATSPRIEIPTLAIERAKMSLASTVASAAKGYSIESARIIRQIELESGGKPAASVWFSQARLPVASSARVNAVASDAAASDDSDLRSIAHIGTIVSTTAIAVGETIEATGLAMLEAMVLGYEVAGRIDEALTPGRMQRGFHGSVSTVFGAAVTAGRLLGLPSDRMAHAIALAATSTGGMAIAADTSCAREYHAGLAAQAGIGAALAARQGFEGELTVLEAPRGFLAAMGGQEIDDISRDLGRSWDIVTDMAIKLMPGAHPFHATAEAAADVARLAQIRPDEIDGIEISSSVQWTKFKGAPHPHNLVDAAHSLFYFVAASIADGGFTWQHMNATKMQDPVIAALQDKVTFDPNPAPLPDRFPHHHGGTVTIRTTDGREFRSTCKAPRGSGPRGVEWADVESKYRELVPSIGLAPAKIDESLALIRAFDSAGAAPRLTDRLIVGAE